MCAPALLDTAADRNDGRQTYRLFPPSLEGGPLTDMRVRLAGECSRPCRADSTRSVSILCRETMAWSLLFTISCSVPGWRWG